MDLALDGRRIVEVATDPRDAAAELTGLLGAYIAPAFADAHVHLLGVARALVEIDLGPATCPTIPDVVAALRASAPALRRSSGWIVARGADEALVAERRSPSRAELDAAVPDAPLRIRHRTGHASLFNTAGWAALPPLPSSARVEVDAAGIPVMVIGAEPWIGAVVGRPARSEVIAGLDLARSRFLRSGIARVWDATPRDAQALDELRELLDAASFDLEVRTMASAPTLDGPRAPADTVKLFPEEHGSALAHVVERAHSRGAAVAIHCTELDELERAIDALERAGRVERPDRIEHATLCRPEHARRIARLGAFVVANPGWLFDRRAKYDEQLTPEERGALMPLRTLRAAGCPLAFGSDAPTSLGEPSDWIRAATAPRDEAVDIEDAVEAARGGELFARGARVPRDPAIIVDRDDRRGPWRVLAATSDRGLRLLAGQDEGPPSGRAPVP